MPKKGLLFSLLLFLLAYGAQAESPYDSGQIIITQQKKDDNNVGKEDKGGKRATIITNSLYAGGGLTYADEEARQKSLDPYATDWKGRSKGGEIRGYFGNNTSIKCRYKLDTSLDVIYSKTETDYDSNNPNVEIGGSKKTDNLEARLKSSFGGFLGLKKGLLKIAAGIKGIYSHGKHEGEMNLDNGLVETTKKIENDTGISALGIGGKTDYSSGNYTIGIGVYYGSSTIDAGTKFKGDFKSGELTFRKGPLHATYTYEEHDNKHEDIDYKQKTNRLMGFYDVGEKLAIFFDFRNDVSQTNYDKVNSNSFSLGLDYKLMSKSIVNK